MPEPRPQRLDELHTRVLTGIRAAPPPRSGKLTGLALSRPRLALGGAVAAGTAVAVATVMVSPAGPSHPQRSGGIQLTAAVILDRAARAERSQPVPHAGQYVNTKVLQYYYGNGSRTGIGAQTSVLWQPVTPGEGTGYITAPHQRMCAGPSSVYAVAPHPSASSGPLSHGYPAAATHPLKPPRAEAGHSSCPPKRTVNGWA